MSPRSRKARPATTPARITGTSSQATVTTTDDTYQVVGTITASTTETIAEMFLSDSATRAQATTVASGASTVIGSSTNTSMNVASASGFPGSGNYDVQVDTEVMTVTAGQGTTTWTVTRGANGSTPLHHLGGRQGDPRQSARLHGHHRRNHLHKGQFQVLP